MDHTEDAGRLYDAELEGYRALAFLTMGDFLDDRQGAALRRFVERGGGWVGIHAASAAGYDWPWYGELVGAWLARHPEIQRATVHVADPDHPIAWCHRVGAGRVVYTALGHTVESFAEPLFLDHFLGALRWACGLAGNGGSR